MNEYNHQDQSNLANKKNRSITSSRGKKQTVEFNLAKQKNMQQLYKNR